MGFSRARWWDIVFGSAELKRRRREALAAGCSNNVEGTRQTHSDVLQLPGAALVAQGGKILWLHRGKHTGDLPLTPALLEIVRQHFPR